MKKMRIDEVCLVNPRQSVNLPENSKISFVPMAAVSVNGQVDSCDTLELKKAKNYTVFQNGDVLFARIRPGHPTTSYPGVAQLVARLLWEQDAAGSNPVTRTTFLRKTAYLGGFFCVFSSVFAVWTIAVLWWF